MDKDVWQQTVQIRMQIMSICTSLVGSKKKPGKEHGRSSSKPSAKTGMDQAIHRLFVRTILLWTVIPSSTDLSTRELEKGLKTPGSMTMPFLQFTPSHRVIRPWTTWSRLQAPVSYKCCHLGRIWDLRRVPHPSYWEGPMLKERRLGSVHLYSNCMYIFDWHKKKKVNKIIIFDIFYVAWTW